MNLSKTPEPPYWAVIFSSSRTAVDGGYAQMAQAMEALAAAQPGYLGLEHAGDPAGSITVSYWRSEADIAAWRAHAEHRVAQQRGRSDWYEKFAVRICRVERAYGFER